MERSRCPKCGSSHRSEYWGRLVQKCPGLRADGTPYTAIICRRCLEYAQARIDKERLYVCGSGANQPRDESQASTTRIMTQRRGMMTPIKMFTEKPIQARQSFPTFPHRWYCLTPSFTRLVGWHSWCA